MNIIRTLLLVGFVGAAEAGSYMKCISEDGKSSWTKGKVNVGTLTFCYKVEGKKAIELDCNTSEEKWVGKFSDSKKGMRIRIKKPGHQVYILKNTMRAKLGTIWGSGEKYSRSAICDTYEPSKESLLELEKIKNKKTTIDDF